MGLWLTCSHNFLQGFYRIFSSENSEHTGMYVEYLSVPL